MRALFALPLLLVLPTCVGPPQPAPEPSPPATLPAPAPTPAPLAADWRDWPLAPGAWRYAATAGGSAATFGAGDMVSLRCDRARGQIVLAAAGGGPLTVRTTSVTRAIVGEASGATLAASDPLLDALAFSRGRFAVERAGQPPLALPVQAEIGRVIEDCRS